MDQIHRLVRNHCPSHHIDFYIFLLAVVCIICSAIFTFIARSLNISMWCPLILLLVPTGLSFWTSKRRSTLIIKIKEVKREKEKKPTCLIYTDYITNVTFSLRVD